MKYATSHSLRGSLSEVIEIVMDRSRDPHVYPNISSNRRTRWDENHPEIHCEYDVCGNGEIPMSLRFLVSPNMLSWRETGCWNTADCTYRYHLTPYYFSNIFHAWGSIKFIEDGPENVIRDLNGEVRVNLPVIGELASRTIVGYMIGNYEKEAREFEKYLEQHRKKRKA